MVLLESSEEWQQQSSLLLQARPSTTRITTKYKLPNLDSPKYKDLKRKRETKSEDKDAAAASEAVPRAVLALKTHDQASGVCLKFKTDRAAEVGRLISGLGRLGRHMAALPQKTEDVVMEDAPNSNQGGTQESKVAPATTAVSTATDGKAPTQTSGGGGKKKRKGKK